MSSKDSKELSEHWKVFETRRYFRIYPDGFPVLMVLLKDGKLLFEGDEGNRDTAITYGPIEWKDVDGSIWYRVSYFDDRNYVLSLSRTSHIKNKATGEITLIIYDPEIGKSKKQ